MFSTPPLMHLKYNGEDLSKLIDYVKTISYIDELTNGVQSNSPSENNYILDENIFANLKKFISIYINQYTEEIFLSNQKLKITQSWINKNKTGSIHTMHYHPNSILSGVFYFNDHSSPIEFISDRKDQFSLHKNEQKYNQFTSSSFTVQTQAGTLIIFPSYIFHRVTMNQQKDTRYSMSFNTFPVDQMGSKNEMSYVKL